MQYSRLLSVFIFLLSFIPYHGFTSQTYEERFTVSARGNKIYYAIDLEPGHKIYWLHPGDSGKETTIDFTGSRNLKESIVYWPLPKQDQVTDAILNYVYEGELVIPVYIAAQDPNKAVRINSTLEYLICYEMCVPVVQKISTSFMADSELPRFNNFTLSNYTLKGSKLSLVASFKQNTHNPSFAIAPKYQAFVDNIKVKKQSSNSYLLEILLDKARYDPENETEFYLYSDKSPIPQKITQDDLAEAPPSLWLVALFAIIGGFILNFMPCVLPVLALKILSLQNSGTSRLSVLMGFLGILVSFIALSFISMAAKQAGHAFGLGINFQQPSFVIALSIIIIIFISMVIGRLQLPISSGLMNYIHKLHVSSEYLNSFITGIVATILATPCTAPFLGTAVSFAVLADNATNLLIFTLIGTGFGLPYLAMIIDPNALKLLPKPGNWLNHFKYFLAILLAGTLVWLLYILSGQLSTKAAMVLLMILVVIKFVLEASTVSPFRMLAKYSALIVLTATSFYIPTEIYRDDQNIEYGRNSMWQEFDFAKLKQHVKEGKIVVVDITADWCMTCKFNKITTLNRGRTIEMLQQPNTVAMRGDITTPDFDVQQFMASIKQFAIPINIVYGPKAPDGILLPTLLDCDDLEAAINSAG